MELNADWTYNGRKRKANYGAGAELPGYGMLWNATAVCYRCGLEPNN